MVGIKSQLKALQFGCRPILVRLSLMESVEIIDNIHLVAFEDIDDIIVFKLPAE